MPSRRFVAVLAPLGFAALMASPLGGQTNANPDLVWPSPPEQARVRWSGSLASEAQLGRKESFFAKLKRTLAGTRLDGMYAISRPFDVFAMDSMRIFVTDGLTPAIIVFDRQAREVQFIGKDVPGGLRKPMGMGGDDQGNLYLADQVGRRVLVFGPDGTFQRAFGGKETLLNPIDVAVDRVADRYYVVDSYQHQVVVFDGRGEVTGRIGRTAATLTGRYLKPTVDVHRPIGDLSDHASAATAMPSTLAHGRAETRDLLDNRSADSGQFRYPVSAAVGPDGSLWVVDQLNFRVQGFDRQGRLKAIIGRIGTTPGSFARPKGIGVDADGHLYVADAAFNNLQIFDRTGRLLLAVARGGYGPGELQLPLGLAIDRRGRVYVADRYNNRIAMFDYLPEPGTGAVNETGHP